KAHWDELYHNLTRFDSPNLRVLASAMDDPQFGGTGKAEPMIIVNQVGKGRIFHTPLGHVMGGKLESIQDPQFQLLVARGTEWAGAGSVTITQAPPPPAGP